MPAAGDAGFSARLRIFGQAARERLVVARPRGRQEIVILLPDEAEAEEPR